MFRTPPHLDLIKELQVVFVGIKPLDIWWKRLSRGNSPGVQQPSRRDFGPRRRQGMVPSGDGECKKVATHRKLVRRQGERNLTYPPPMDNKGTRQNSEAESRSVHMCNVHYLVLTVASKPDVMPWSTLSVDDGPRFVPCCRGQSENRIIQNCEINPLPLTRSCRLCCRPGQLYTTYQTESAHDPEETLHCQTGLPI